MKRTNGLKGRQVDPHSLAEVRALIGPATEQKPHRPDLLIEHLHLLNDHYHGLFERHLCALAQLMNLPMAHVFEVASFYHHFQVLADTAIAPELTIRVCDGLSCQLNGGAELLKTMTHEVDASLAVVAVPCIGRCEQAPAVCVGQHGFGHATAELVRNSVAKQRQANQPERALPEYIRLDQYRQTNGYQLLSQLLNGQLQPASVIDALDQSGLRGLGGAGFPAGRKWRILLEQPAPRFMAVNVDEGEPGTFKDRIYLERDPHRFLEGMLIAATVTQCSALYIYLRDEYHDCRRLLQTTLQELKDNWPSATPIPTIELRRGAGAYICGEESAMIQSIEGLRGEPRMRPPYIAQVGLFGRPTLEHNFETLYWVRDIVEKGAKWFASQGRHGRSGLRSFSLSGRVKNPGVKLAPAGITAQELIQEYGGGMLDGHELYAYLPGGASGGILPASLANIPLDFDTLQPYGCFIGSAAVIVLSQHDRARDAALNMMLFFAHESCGQCTPCRVGTTKAVQLMQTPNWDLTTLGDLNQVMRDASICGLGQAAPNPVQSVITYFANEVTGKTP